MVWTQIAESNGRLVSDGNVLTPGLHKQSAGDIPSGAAGQRRVSMF